MENMEEYSIRTLWEYLMVYYKSGYVIIDPVQKDNRGFKSNLIKQDMSIYFLL